MALTSRRLSRRGLAVAAVAGIAIAFAGCAASDSELDDSDIEVDLSGAGSNDLEAASCVNVAALAALRDDGDSLPRIVIRVDHGEQTSPTESTYAFSGVTSAIDESQVDYVWTCVVDVSPEDGQLVASITSFERVG